ncbi:MAG: hypothetical protein ABI968_11415, partial [Acidobacteriota bacterium]
TMTPTPTITQTPTITPTPGPGFVILQVVSWQWNFYTDMTGATCALTWPYNSCAPVSPGNELNLQAGRTYTLYMVNADSPEVTENHKFNGVPSLGLPPVTLLQGRTYGPYTLNPTTPGDFTFNCLNTSCGTSEQHEGMVGVFHVVP